MCRVNAAFQRGGDWQSEMPPVTRGWRIYCWRVVDCRTGRTGYECSDYPISTGWVPPMHSGSPKGLKSLAVRIRKTNESIRLLPWYPGASDTWPYRVRALSPREVRELARYIEISQVDELRENQPNKPLHGTPAKAPSSSTEPEGRRP